MGCVRRLLGQHAGFGLAEQHPDRVRALVVRGIFLLRAHEIRWFYQEGASFIFPDAWEAYVDPIAEEERGDLVQAYYRRLTGSDPEARSRAALAWSAWEMTTNRLIPDPELIARYTDPKAADALARIKMSLHDERRLLQGARRTTRQHRRDPPRSRHHRSGQIQFFVCPMTTAWDLHRRWPEADFEIVADAGHNPAEPGTRDRLLGATDRFRFAV